MKPRSPRSHLASGTGETGGTMDELTMAEEQEVAPPQLAVARAAQLAVARAAPPAPPGARQGRRPGSSAGDGALSPAWLVVQAGTDRGRRFPVKIGRTTIGRGVENDVVLTDIAVSRRHLIIDNEGPRYVMTDVGSGNGTLINDRDEDGAYQLSHGDRLELGNTVLVFECAELAARAAPGKRRWTREDEEMSTVAGKKPALSPAEVAAAEAIAGAQRRAGPAGAPPERHLPLEAAPAAPAMQPRNSPSTSPPVPAAKPNMPTIAAASLGIGGPTPSEAVPGHPAYTSQPSYPSGPSYPSYQSYSPHVGHPQPSPLPRMGSGFSPFPGTNASYPQAGASYAGAGAAARFQYPGGVMGPPLGTDRRRLLIAILGVAFVAVSIGIVVALVQSRDRGRAGAAAKRDADPALAVTASGGPAVAAGANPDSASGGDGSSRTAASDSEAAGVPLASLMGPAQLSATRFGTDEAFLSDAPPPPLTGDGQLTAERISDSGRKTGAPDRKTTRDEPKRSPSEPKRITRTAPDDEDEDEVVMIRRTTGDAAGARRQAEALYRDKKWEDAASALRKELDDLPKKEAGRLRTLAVHYERIGSLMAEGQRSFTSDPPKSLNAFRKARSLDEQHGGGAHDGFIGAKIGQVAPKAARLYRARNQYAEAKRACDDADVYGSGSEVRIVRDSLEKVAEQLYDEANALALKGKNADAASKAREIQRMVPPRSPVHAKAGKLLRK